MKYLKGRRLGVVALVAAVAIVVSAGVAGSIDSFTDVPDTHPFHDDITWMSDNFITSGCGGGKYCPSSSVTRGQMAVFMHNLASIQVVAGGLLEGSGTPDVPRGFDHVTGTVPTITDNGAGDYSLDLGWDTGDAFGVCTLEGAGGDKTCSIEMLGATGIRIRIFDIGDAALADADVFYQVYGLG